MNQAHELKTHPEPFAAIQSGRKTFELRWDDRDFQVGDVLVLREWDQEMGYTGDVLARRVSYLLLGEAWGLPPGFVIMSLEAPAPRRSMSGADKSLRELQASLPWTAHYHRDFRATPMTHKDFGHALLHVHKAGGKLAAILDEAEHAGFDWASAEKRADVSKYVADLVICALRMATTCPDGQLDLQRIVEDRLTAKNNQLAEVAPALAAAERMA